MKSLLLSFIFLTISTFLFAQDKEYTEKAAQFQKDIWGNAAPEFKGNSIPANLNNESAVVLARSYSALWTSGSRFKFSLMGAGLAKHMEKTIIFHEKVKINDKSALESFSTIEYQKKLDNTTNLLFTAKLKNTKNTFIGVKITKPTGKEVLVNTGEEVLLANDAKDKKGKLAIPDLQVGDILDYYVANAVVEEGVGGGESFEDNENIFILADEYPVLYYGIDFQFDKKVKTQYVYANGAPHFNESKDKDDNELLSLKLHNLPKYESKLWTVPLRQYPYIEIGAAYLTSFNGADKIISKQNSMFDGERQIFENSFTEFSGFDELEKKTKDYFGGKKNMKNAPVDSVMKVMYDLWKFDLFCTYRENQFDDKMYLHYPGINSKFAASMFSMILTDMEIDHDVLLVASRNSNSLENVYGMNDFDAAIRINLDKPVYMFFEDPYTHFNEIPERFQGEKIQVMHTKRHITHSAQKYTFSYSDAVLPVISSDKNRSEEYIQVSLSPTNLQRLSLDRTVKETGAVRHWDQNLLVPMEDIDDTYTKMVKGPDLKKRLSESYALRKKTDLVYNAFAKEKSDAAKNFTTEIKSMYDQEPQQLISYKMVNNYLENYFPVFEFNEKFTFDNMVKKAGNNYIVDAGKLCGTFLNLDNKDRKRDIDVYMTAARAFNYTISIDIPQGYSAKGMEELTMQKSNKTGSFSSSATVNGNKLVIKLNRVYTDNFEKAADWPLLVDLISTASDFNSKKILLEKVN